MTLKIDGAPRGAPPQPCASCARPNLLLLHSIVQTYFAHACVSNVLPQKNSCRRRWSRPTQPQSSPSRCYALPYLSVKERPQLPQLCHSYYERQMRRVDVIRSLKSAASLNICSMDPRTYTNQARLPRCF